MGELKGKVWTYALTNGVLVITEDDGLENLSIINYDAVDGSVQGNQTIQGLASVAIPIKSGVAPTFVNMARSLDGITITAPAGCTLYIMASRV